MSETGAGRKLFVIPAFNEGESIDSVIRDLLTVATPDEILIVNDGSEDNTADIVGSHPVNNINFTINLGVASAILAGFRYAKRFGYDTVIQFDGDGQHIAGQAGKIIGPVLDGECDIAIGCREEGFQETSTLARRWGGKLISLFLKAFTGNRHTDPTSGFRAYSKVAIDQFAQNFPDEYPEVESIVLASKLGLSVKEYPVQMRGRIGGKSSISSFGSAYYMTKVLLASMIMMLRRY